MKNKTQKGYALLITMVIISIILLIAIGLSSSTSKQLILSSSAKDSQTAFYQADTASECALYYDYKLNSFVDIETFDSDGKSVVTPRTENITCGGQDMTVNYNDVSDGQDITIEKPNSNTINSQCFRIIIGKRGESPVVTTIKASGYNICNKSNIRTVERTIQVSY